MDKRRYRIKPSEKAENVTTQTETMEGMIEELPET